MGHWTITVGPFLLQASNSQRVDDFAAWMDSLCTGASINGGWLYKPYASARMGHKVHLSMTIP